MNEQLVSFIHLVRFDAFPYVPLEYKIELLPILLRFPIEDRTFHEAAHILIQANQFQSFVGFLKDFKRYKKLHVWDPRKDMDLVISIYMSEHDPGLSREILKTIMSFSISDELSYCQYKMGLNLLFSSTCSHDTRLAIAFLNAD